MRFAPSQLQNEGTVQGHHHSDATVWATLESMGPLALSSMTPALLRDGTSACNLAADFLAVAGSDGLAGDERGDKNIDGGSGEVDGDGDWDALEEEGCGTVGEGDRNEEDAGDGEGDCSEEDAGNEDEDEDEDEDADGVAEASEGC